MARWTFKHGRDMQLLGGILLGLPVLALVLALVLPWVSSMKSSLAASRVQPTPAPIDGNRAYGYLKTICAIGPRPAGSEANTRQRELVARHFERLGGKIREHRFEAPNPLGGPPVAMVNLIGSWAPERTERVLLGVHYDTRPFPDMDPDPARRRDPFLGANDGASGVALLMEIAHHLKDLKTPWGVDLVLFDGEELVYQPGDEYFLGSKEFGRVYAASRERDGPGRVTYAAALVLDMVGDRRLQIAPEVNSVQLAPALVRQVWDVARQLKARAFLFTRGPQVSDDHLPLNEAGIPAIDLIDFDYPAWHTAADLPDRCSGASLEQVGRVVTGWLSLPKPPAPRRPRR